MYKYAKVEGLKIKYAKLRDQNINYSVIIKKQNEVQ